MKYIIRFFFRLIRDIDGIFTYLVSWPFKSPYSLKGSCQKRGICCTKIAKYLHDIFWKYTWLKTIAIRYYCFVYNFKMTAELKKEKVVLFRCHYLRKKQCSIHWRRPLICRKYPQLRFFLQPEMLPGCGYYVSPYSHPKK